MKLHFSKARVGLFLFICVLLVGSLFFSPQIESFINKGASIESGQMEDIDSDALELHFIYVGQGDSTAIRFPDGKTMLIDAGPGSAKNDLLSYLNDVFFSGHEKVIDYFVITHTDEDHVGGAKTILDAYNVKNVYRPNVLSKSEETVPGVKVVTSNVWDNTVTAMSKAQNVITIEQDLAGPTYSNPQDPSQDYSFTFYGPISANYSDVNDYSPVMMLENNGVKYMFTGDASENVEEEFLTEYNAYLNTFDVDVLKLGHHGSSTSSSEEFISVVKPEWAIVSCGIDNKYGHPTNETITRLTNANSQILRTDISGSILLYQNDDQIKYIADFFEPANYYIEWWYIVVGLAFCSGAVCFLSKTNAKKVIKKLYKK